MPTPRMSDQRYYEIVAQELQRRFIRPGLWARAVAETGNEGATARALYIRFRVEELVQEEQAEEAQRRASEERQQEIQEEQKRAHEVRATSQPPPKRNTPDWVYIMVGIIVVWLAVFIWKNFIE